MTHVYDLADAKLNQPSVVTIGMFDGVHIGHQVLIKRLVETAHNSGRQAVVLTFYPHPDIVLRGLEGRYYLTTPDQRAQLLIELGVDCVVTHPFNDEIRQIRASTFVDHLREYLKMDALWVGEDFAMGYQREGNVAFLKKDGERKGFNVEVIHLVSADGNGIPITSTRIRQSLADGDLDTVRQLLGRGYTVIGEVVEGEKRGRAIGFPTANIAVWDQLIIPANGVYAGWATVNDQQNKAVTNVGIRPTFVGDDMTVEAHLLDFTSDIYGQTLELSFETKLRDEQKFSGIDELVAQIQHDVEAGRLFLESQ